MDIDKDGTVDKIEFEKFLAKIGVFLKTQELRNIYNHFDKNRDGRITFHEFIGALKV